MAQLDPPAAATRIVFRPRDQGGPCWITLQLHIGLRVTSTELHVVEKRVDLPTFCCLGPLALPRNARRAPGLPAPTGAVECVVPRCAPARLLNFLALHFMYKSVPTARAAEADAPCVVEQFAVIPAGSGNNAAPSDAAPPPSTVMVEGWQVEGPETNGRAMRVRIRADTMTVAGAVLRTLFEFVGATDMDTQAHFPSALRAVAEAATAVEAGLAQRVVLAADAADETTAVKALVVKAEDARLLGNMPLMSMHYTALFARTQRLVAAHTVRAGNEERLRAGLRGVNDAICAAANLKCGKPKADLILAARQAVKARRFGSLAGLLNGAPLAE